MKTCLKKIRKKRNKLFVVLSYGSRRLFGAFSSQDDAAHYLAKLEISHPEDKFIIETK